MKYYKVIEDGYISAIGVNIEGEEITEEEYAELLHVIRNKPIPPEEHDYRLTEDLRWEIWKTDVE